MSTADEQTIRWSVHPAREQPARAVAALVVVLVACTFVWLTVGGPQKLILASIAAGVAAAILLASLSKFFLRSHFEMDSESITARYPFSSRSFKWQDLRRFVADRHGGYLSTRRRPSRWDAFSGMQVLFDQDRDRIEGRIRELVEREDSA
ncbi:MAG: hypothetical protein MK116_01055 [Phycisphaerales bacterium]|nr:hypothetical protein [Phycisphaerales bacterium]